MRQLIKLLYCIGLVFVFLACDSKEENKDSSNTESIKTFRIGMNAEYPPFEFKKDAEIVGFDVDILKAISKKVGFEYTLHHMSFDGLIPALKAGKIDMIISGMSATNERLKQVDFSIPYYEGITLFIKKKDNHSITNKESIRGKRVGVYIGTVQEQAINKIKDEYSLTVIPSDSIFGAIMNLKTNKADVVLADLATAQGYVSIDKNNNLTSYPEELTIDLPVYIISKPKEQLAVGDVIALERSYAKVTKISDGKITAISYTGSGKTIHTIKDFLFNQTMVRVVVSLAGNVGGQINPMLLLALSNKDDKDALLPLLMMNQNGGALGMNPMMLMMLTDKGEGTSMKDMLLLSAMSGGNMFGGMFGQVPQPAKAKEAPAVEPQPEIED